MLRSDALLRSEVDYAGYDAWRPAVAQERHGGERVLWSRLRGNAVVCTFVDKFRCLATVPISSVLKRIWSSNLEGVLETIRRTAIEAQPNCIRNARPAP